MAKLLKVTKPDKTIHTMPLDNKAFYLAYNNRLPVEQRWTIEEIDEEEAIDHPFIDESFVTPLEGAQKANELQKVVVDKDKEIEELKKQLAEKQTPAAPKFSADQAIALIGVAKSADQVNELIKDDTRVTVKAAADAKIAELTKA